MWTENCYKNKFHNLYLIEQVQQFSSFWNTLSICKNGSKNKRLRKKLFRICVLFRVTRSQDLDVNAKTIYNWVREYKQSNNIKIDSRKTTLISKLFTNYIFELPQYQIPRKLRTIFFLRNHKLLHLKLHLLPSVIFLSVHFNLIYHNIFLLNY
jgi:hypothetical protein